MRREEPSKHPLLRTAVMNEEYFGIVESLMLEVKSLRLQLDLLSSRGLLEAEGGETQGSAGGEEEELALEALVNETLEAAGCSDLQSLRGPRRVRRLEILLAAALDRERRCELRRHKMDKFSQYLNSSLERKEDYFDALRSYFSGLVDYAAGEACYLPEFTARLVLFRQQLAHNDGRHTAEMLDGTIEAFLVAEEGLNDDGMESPSGLCYVSTQNLLEHELSTRSRSYSYGYLLGEAARRNGRRSTTHMKQLASSSGLSKGAPETNEESTSELAPAAPAQLELHAENALLRRQLETHPELYRLSAENRFLREHLAMLVQQKASGHEDFYKEEKEMRLSRTTSRLRSPRERSKAQSFSLKHFPGIEEVTHLSSDSDSEASEGLWEDRGADVTSFLPAMAQKVQELFRVKKGMEDALRQQLKARRGEGKALERQVRVDPDALAEGLEGATAALQNAEAVVAGAGGELFLGEDVADSLRRSEGMDEREVFLSLMRSLPGESQAPKREGLSASPSVPALSRMESKRKRAASGGEGCLQRMKSTMQLHRIVEAPSVQELADGSSTAEDLDLSFPGRLALQMERKRGEQLRVTIQQVRSLSKQLEAIGEMYKEVKAQTQPMQQEYARRLEECRFLEAQCRRLDVHCRLLQERLRGRLPKPLSMKAESHVTTQLSQTLVMPCPRFTPVSVVPQAVQQGMYIDRGQAPQPLQRSASLAQSGAPAWAQGVCAARIKAPEVHVLPQEVLRRVVSAPQLIHMRSVSSEPRPMGRMEGAAIGSSTQVDMRLGEPAAWQRTRIQL